MQKSGETALENPRRKMILLHQLTNTACDFKVPERACIASTFYVLFQVFIVLFFDRAKGVAKKFRSKKSDFFRENNLIRLNQVQLISIGFNGKNVWDAFLDTLNYRFGISKRGFICTLQPDFTKGCALHAVWRERFCVLFRTLGF